MEANSEYFTHYATVLRFYDNEHAHLARQLHALSFRAILREVYLLIFSGDSESVYLTPAEFIFYFICKR